MRISPELNERLATLACAEDEAGRGRVLIVDHATGFNLRVDTIDDRVHPSAAGAEKMAQAWFAALRTILPIRQQSIR